MSTLVVDLLGQTMANRYRKRMRLQDWDYSQAAMYMITICVADRTHRLGTMTESDTVRLSDAGRMVVEEIERLDQQHPQIVLDEYIVMPNHVHLLLGLNPRMDEASPVSLRRVVGELKSRTTNRYVNGVKRGLLPPFDRHLWQVDYYETIMRDGSWTDQRREYILSNPANWRDDPEMA